MNNEKPKKKRPVFLIVMLFILGIGCIGGGYYLNESGLFDDEEYDMSEEYTESDEIEEENGEEQETTNTSENTEYEKYNKLIDSLLKIDLARERENSCSPLDIFVIDKKVVANDISNDMAWDIIMYDSSFEKGESISLDSVNSAIKKYLGKDYIFDPKSVNTNVCNGHYEYDETTKTYNLIPIQGGGCGGSCGPKTVYKIVKAVDTDGTLVLNVKVVFAKYEEGSEYAYFSDYARTNGIGSNLFDTDINTLFEKGADYLFTFKLEDGNYVFVSSEPAK